MYVAVVKGNVARDRRAVLLGLGVDDVHVKVIAEIVVSATYFFVQISLFYLFYNKNVHFFVPKVDFYLFHP